VSLFLHQSSTSQVAASEEQKDTCLPKQEIEVRVERIMAQIEPQTKKIDKSKDFRAFMKTVKADVKEGDSEKMNHWENVFVKFDKKDYMMSSEFEILWLSMFTAYILISN